LRRAYLTAPLGNKSNPLDELVYIQLSIRTREGAYQETYRALRRLVRGSWQRLASLPTTDVQSALTAGGMARMKHRRLLTTFELLSARFGRVTLSPLRRMSDSDAEGVLRSLPGVGPKVARCVLLYSLGRNVFPVDSHCYRVLGRLGLVPPGLGHRGSHDLLNALVPPRLRGRLHVNLVHHGRSVCLPTNPRCHGCVLRDICPMGRATPSPQPKHRRRITEVPEQPPRSSPPQSARRPRSAKSTPTAFIHRGDRP
jgi:endonuclease III